MSIAEAVHRQLQSIYPHGSRYTLLIILKTTETTYSNCSNLVISIPPVPRLDARDVVPESGASLALLWRLVILLPGAEVRSAAGEVALELRDLPLFRVSLVGAPRFLTSASSTSSAVHVQLL